MSTLVVERVPKPIPTTVSLKDLPPGELFRFAFGTEEWEQKVYMKVTPRAGRDCRYVALESSNSEYQQVGKVWAGLHERRVVRLNGKLVIEGDESAV